MHTPANQHFARIVLTYDPLLGSNAQIKEFVGGKKFALKPPIVLLASYTARYSDNRGDNVVKSLSGAIIVLEPGERGDFNQEEAIYEKTERLASELMGYADEKLELPQYLEWNAAANERLANVAGYYGTRFEFNINMPAYQEIKWNPAQFGE